MHHSQAQQFDSMSSYLETVAARWNEARRLTQGYFHSHWNTVEWVFTARLLLAGMLITVNRGNYLGLILVVMGMFGVCVSGQWCRSFWLNIAFAVSVLLLSVGLFIMRVAQGDWENFLLYIHVLDIGFSIWLCKRITEEKFYYDVACDHSD